jgi:uncharacterized OsmC-like protein
VNPDERLVVSYAGGDRFDIAIGQHRITVDQPVSMGGNDEGPTPTELFLASLVSCMGFFAQRFLRKNGVDPMGLTLEATMRGADRPHRVGSVDISVHVPAEGSTLTDAVRRVMDHCTVHNTLLAPPEVNVVIEAKGAQPSLRTTSRRTGRASSDADD